MQQWCRSEDDREGKQNTPGVKCRSYRSVSGNPLENSSTVRTRRSEREASSSRCDEEETDGTVAENREERRLDHGGLDAHSNTGLGVPLLVN
ncbi:hypothetical protein CgunFtcFv8_010869 [Champsocephalus gunnari]|uniref:Uncharacterized protein n=1 Tax=Champsocephalus gunnari TaxID=52237 RepID=A0AAN8DWW1_CHAGU|nr:hypothetical protein CgunFtcFv8_010869 [Champsocephalus gunnari]